MSNGLPLVYHILANPSLSSEVDLKQLTSLADSDHKLAVAAVRLLFVELHASRMVKRSLRAKLERTHTGTSDD